MDVVQLSVVVQIAVTSRTLPSHGLRGPSLCLVCRCLQTVAGEEWAWAGSPRVLEVYLYSLNLCRGEPVRFESAL